MSTLSEFQKIFLKLSIEEKKKCIKRFEKRLKELHKQRQKALQNEIEYGFNRRGTRGGRFTTLNAKAQNVSRLYFDCEEDIKFMNENL